MSGKSQTIGDLTVLLLPNIFPNDDITKSMTDGDKESCSNFPRHIMIRLTTMLGNLQIKIYISTTRDIDE